MVRRSSGLTLFRLSDCKDTTFLSQMQVFCSAQPKIIYNALISSRLFSHTLLCFATNLNYNPLRSAYTSLYLYIALGFSMALLLGKKQPKKGVKPGHFQIFLRAFRKFSPWRKVQNTVHFHSFYSWKRFETTVETFRNLLLS
jgi:hypothetical protein